jgi:hypothetical protein
MNLPVFDREREFMFKNANIDTYTGKTLVISFFVFMFIVLFVRYTGKREKSHRQYGM